MIPVYTFLEDAVFSLRNEETVWKTSLISKRIKTGTLELTLVYNSPQISSCYVHRSSAVAFYSILNFLFRFLFDLNLECT